MVKDKTIVIRVSAEEKERLEAAAKVRNQSVTSFLVDSGKKEAAKKPRVSSATFNGVPTFFGALCAEARLGGTNGYYLAGHEFTRQLESNSPHELSEDEWYDQLEALQRMADDEDDRGIWKWLLRIYPRCMELVPTRRREQFLKGMYDYLDENQLF